MYCKTIILSIDATLASDNSSRFVKSFTVDDNIKDEKLQYDINRKIATLSSGIIDKYEYLTGEEILPSDQSTFIYSPLKNDLGKQTKTSRKIKTFFLF